MNRGKYDSTEFAGNNWFCCGGAYMMGPDCRKSLVSFALIFLLSVAYCAVP